MNIRLVLMLSALTLVATCPCARAGTFDDLWGSRIKPPPYAGIATEFDDTIAADGRRLHPDRDLVCAHMLERLGQRLRVTNVANGKSVVCTVADKGPNRKFWPRREIDLTPPASRAIGCDGMCSVSLERVAE
jgi:rare lipoprotein A (peptidoglycan hydrolase)